MGYNFTVDVEFAGSCVSTVAASRLTLEALSKDHTPPKLAFFPQNVPQPADSAATPGSGFATTITEHQVGGCGSDSAWVSLDGIGIGKAYVPFVSNFDLNNTGGVDAADLATFAPALNTCLGHPSYNPCADFAGSTGCIDASDVASFAVHLGHIWSNPQFKGGTGTVTKLRLEPGSPPGSARIAVRLEGLRGRSAYGAVLRPGASRLRFAGWLPRPGYETTTAAVDTVDGQGRRLAVLAFSVAPDPSGSAELGTLLFTTTGGEVAVDDVPITYEDAAEYADDLASTSIAQIARASVTRLHPNEPNPFNFRTTIHYTLGDAGTASLEVFDVAGRRIRTLVQGSQDPGEHSVVWDGRDESGREVGAGIYVVRLVAGGGEESKKLMVVR